MPRTARSPHPPQARPARVARRVPWWLPLLALVAFATDVRADFGECSDSGYVETFDPRIAADPFGCVERMRVAVETLAGTRHIRVVEGFAADWSYATGYPEAVVAGVRATVDALAAIGDFRIDDVTVLLVDDLPAFDPGERDRSHMLAEAGAPVDGECRVAVFPLARGGTDFVAFTVAHELFHCVQYAMAGRERVQTLNRGAEAGGDWWVEGSAEWFAELAVPGTDELDDRVTAFDALSINTPLHDMAYEAVLLYLWLADEEGPAAVTGSFADMADSASAAAQQSAMRRMLSDEQWLAFTRAYLDREVVGPAGAAIDIDPVTFQDIIDEPRTLERTLEPFVLERRALRFLCGRWTLAAGPGDANLQSREPEGEWGAPPARINAGDADDDDHLLAAINTGSEDFDLVLEIGVEAGCEPCGESEEIDDCLVGRWRRTGGGGIEWVRRQLPADISIPGFEETGLAFVFRSDGTYLTQRYDAEMSYRHRTVEGLARGEGRITSQSAGRWSVGDGSLVICPDSESVGGSVSVTMPEGVTLSAPITDSRGGGAQEMGYRCGEAEFRTRMVFPTSSDPLTTTYTRVERDSGAPAEGALIGLDGW